MNAWTMEIKLYSSSFEGLKHIVKQILADVSKAKSFKEFPRSGAGGGGGDPIGSGFNVTYQCPDELRIAALRKEADELEAKLRGDA